MEVNLCNSSYSSQSFTPILKCDFLSDFLQTCVNPILWNNLAQHLSLLLLVMLSWLLWLLLSLEPEFECWLSVIWRPRRKITVLPHYFENNNIEWGRRRCSLAHTYSIVRVFVFWILLSHFAGEAQVPYAICRSNRICVSNKWHKWNLCCGKFKSFVNIFLLWNGL